MVATLVLVVLGSNHANDPEKTSSDQALPAVSAAAPPHAAEQASACAKWLAAQPVSLGKLAPRIVHTKSTYNFVVAWGDPAVQASCGVDKPKALTPGSSTQFISGGDLDGPFYDVTRDGDANVYTTVDRGPFVALRIPKDYPAADYLPLLSRAIAKALPAVCETQSSTDPDKLCTRRTK